MYIYIYIYVYTYIYIRRGNCAAKGTRGKDCALQAGREPKKRGGGGGSPIEREISIFE